MNALAYLLGARALDIARETGSAKPNVPEAPMGPLATTEERTSAWRRWTAARETVAAEPHRRPRRAPMSSQPRPTPI